MAVSSSRSALFNSAMTFALPFMANRVCQKAVFWVNSGEHISQLRESFREAWFQGTPNVPAANSHRTAGYSVQEASNHDCSLLHVAEATGSGPDQQHICCVIGHMHQEAGGH